MRMTRPWRCPPPGTGSAFTVCSVAGTKSQKQRSMAAETGPRDIAKWKTAGKAQNGCAAGWFQFSTNERTSALPRVLVRVCAEALRMETHRLHGS